VGNNIFQCSIIYYCIYKKIFLFNFM